MELRSSHTECDLGYSPGKSKNCKTSQRHYRTECARYRMRRMLRAWMIILTICCNSDVKRIQRCIVGRISDAQSLPMPLYHCLIEDANFVYIFFWFGVLGDLQLEPPSGHDSSLTRYGLLPLITLEEPLSWPIPSSVAALLQHLQHLGRGLPIQVLTGPMLLDFRDRMGTGA